MSRTFVKNVITADEASLILQHKDCVRPGSLVNVHGEVSAISEVFRVKNDHLFLIQLEKVFIVIRADSLLRWQELITPFQEFVFSNLRPTTIYKGIPTPTRVFVPWTDCEVFAVDDVTISTISIQKWLEENAVKDIEYDIDSHNIEMKDDVPGLISYQGVVTCTTYAKYGIYELDRKIRLYVSGVPARHRFEFLTEGARVIVYNTHRENFTEDAKIHLHCCVKACVKLTGASTTPQPGQVGPFSRSSKVVKLFTNYRLDGRGISSLLAMVERIKLMAKDPTQTEQIVSEILSSVCCWLKPCSRNFVSEFLSVPHCCHLSPCERTSRGIPKLTQIIELHAPPDDSDQQLDTVSKKQLHSNTPSSQLNMQVWSYLPRVIHKNVQQILVGRFEFSAVSGRLELQDDTGSIDVLVSYPASDAHTCDHCCPHLPQGQPVTCPKVQPVLNQCLVAVTKCEVITEQFLCPHRPQDDSMEVIQSQHITYLLVSLPDCVVLNSTDDMSPESSEPCAKQPRVSVDGDLSTSILAVSKRRDHLLFVTHVESLMVKSFTHKKSLGFCLVGYVIGDSAEVDREQGEISKHISSLDCSHKIPEAKCRTSGAGDVTPAGNDMTAAHSAMAPKTSAMASTTSAMAPTTSANTPTTSAMAPTTSAKAPTTSAKAPTTSVMAPTTSAKAPTTSSKVPTTSATAPTSVKAPTTSAMVPSTSAKAPTTSATSPTSVKAPTTSAMVPSTSAKAPTTSATAPTSVKAPTTSDMAPSTSAKAPTTSATAPTSVKAPTTSAKAPTTSAKAPTTSAVTPSHSDATVGGLGRSTVPVVLVFQGRSVRWYPCLQAGSFYRLTVGGNKPVFKSKAFYGAKLKAAVKFSQTRMCFQVDDEVLLEKVLSSSVKGFSEEMKKRLEPPALYSIEEILSESFSGTVVSFRGQILTRKHLDDKDYTSWSYKTQDADQRDKHLGLSLLNRRTVCLEIAGSWHHSVYVYMKLDNMSYPQGLLPGTTVTFTRLERRVSASGAVYCQYTPVSTVTVHHDNDLGSPSSNTRGTAHYGDAVEFRPQLGVRFLADLYSDPPVRVVGSVQIAVHIVTFLKLSLRVECTDCGSLFTSGRCGSQHCRSDSSKLSAKARILVDDGSAPAVVCLYQWELVRRVLRLSQQQWQDLHDVVQGDGEVFIHQFFGWRGVDSYVESFLMLLCDSAQVKRNVHLCVKPTRTSGRRTPLDTNRLTTEEFLYKKITTGLGTVETRCHPYLQLECQDLQEEMFYPSFYQTLTS